jgi:hypothetical protein
LVGVKKRKRKRKKGERGIPNQIKLQVSPSHL